MSKPASLTTLVRSLQHGLEIDIPDNVYYHQDDAQAAIKNTITDEYQDRIQQALAKHGEWVQTRHAITYFTSDKLKNDYRPTHKGISVDVNA